MAETGPWMPLKDINFASARQPLHRPGPSRSRGMGYKSFETYVLRDGQCTAAEHAPLTWRVVMVTTMRHGSPHLIFHDSLTARRTLWRISEQEKPREENKQAQSGVQRCTSDITRPSFWRCGTALPATARRPTACKGNSGSSRDPPGSRTVAKLR